MPFSLADLTATPLVAALKDGEARFVRAVRSWVVLNKLEQPYGAPVADLLGSRAAAVELDLLMMRVGVAWTEAFTVNPPCCPRMTHDEALMLGLVRAAAAGDRPGFDGQLAEMLGADARESLYHAACHLAEALTPAPSSR